MNIIKRHYMGKKCLIAGDSLTGSLRIENPDGSVETTAHTIIVTEARVVDTMVFFTVDENNDLGLKQGIGVIFGENK